MAKKKGELKQTRIPGTSDRIPKAVQDAADAYIKAKRSKAKQLEKMNGCQEVLIELMTKHDIVEIDIDDGEKRLVLEDSSKLSVKKKSDSNPPNADDNEAFT